MSSIITQNPSKTWWLDMCTVRYGKNTVIDHVGDNHFEVLMPNVDASAAPPILVQLCIVPHAEGGTPITQLMGGTELRINDGTTDYIYSNAVLNPSTGAVCFSPDTAAGEIAIPLADPNDSDLWTIHADLQVELVGGEVENYTFETNLDSPFSL